MPKELAGLEWIKEKGNFLPFFGAYGSMKKKKKVFADVVREATTAQKPQDGSGSRHEFVTWRKWRTEKVKPSGKTYSRKSQKRAWGDPSPFSFVIFHQFNIPTFLFG